LAEKRRKQQKNQEENMKKVITCVFGAHRVSSKKG